MFLRTMKMELCRAFRPSRIILVLLLINLLWLGSDFNYLRNAIKQAYNTSAGSVDMLYFLMGIDSFKCVIAVLLCAVYTGSFSKDDNSHYLRFILNRLDMTTYIQCRFLANVLAILITSICSFYVYVLTMAPLMPMIPKDGPDHSHYYVELVENCPILYVGVMGVIFGLVVAACSSVGLLYSAYRADSFVSIACGGLVLFLALSYIPYGNPFDILSITGMSSSLGWDAPWPLMLLWILVYMASVIGVCGFLFYRRMKWRMENGYL